MIFGNFEINYIGHKKKQVIETAKKRNRLAAVALYRELFNTDLETAAKQVNKWIGYKPISKKGGLI